MSHQDIIDKLKKLMLKEESCKKIGNVEEAALYSSKIAEWCMRYKIERVRLEEDLDNPIDTKMDTTRITPTEKRGGRSPWWQNRVAAIVCEHTGCAHCTYSGSNDILIIGAETDRGIAEHLITTIVRFIVKESQRAYDKRWYEVCEKEKKPSWLLKDYKNSWILGALGVFAERIEDSYAKIEIDNPGVSTALVLAKDCEKARDYMKSVIKPKDTVINSPAMAFNTRALEEGRAAARNAGLHRAVGSGSENKKLA